MESSQILLNNCLSILTVSGALMVLLIGAFVIKLLADLSKLIKNVDDTVEVLKEETKPILSEINTTISGVSAMIKGFDKNVNGLSKFFGGFAAAGLLAFSKARLFSKGALRKVIVWIVSLIKLIIKK